MTTAAQFWIHLEGEEAKRKAQLAASRLKPFRILIGQRGSPRLDFACMAQDSATAVMQHMDLAQVGERVEAVAP